MRLDLKHKIIRYALITFGVVLLMFIIIFNGVWFGDMNNPHNVDMSFGLAFALPLLVSIISFTLSGYFKSFTKQDAIAQIEKQYRNGLISTDHYQKSLKELEIFELEKFKLKAKVEMEKENIKAQVLAMAAKNKKEFYEKEKEKVNN